MEDSPQWERKKGKEGGKEQNEMEKGIKKRLNGQSKEARMRKEDMKKEEKKGEVRRR